MVRGCKWSLLTAISETVRVSQSQTLTVCQSLYSFWLADVFWGAGFRERMGVWLSLAKHQRFYYSGLEFKVESWSLSGLVFSINVVAPPLTSVCSCFSPTLKHTQAARDADKAVKNTICTVLQQKRSFKVVFWFSAKIKAGCLNIYTWGN